MGSHWGHIFQWGGRGPSGLLVEPPLPPYVARLLPWQHFVVSRYGICEILNGQPP